ncbi:MAG: HEAT repeat domain-containing protein [Verrucomicrobia bacterium]|nr:HEAT repeat domain-containing protein [Verrucomicrobiota bacterium]
MTLGTRIKVGGLVGMTLVMGLATGFLFYGWSENNQDAKPKPIRRLIRDLRKQDSAFDTACQALWTKLPGFFTGRFRSLEPTPAAHLRRFAAEELRYRGPQAQTAIPALIGALGDADIDVRTRVIQALRELGPLADKAVPDLIRYFQNPKYAATGSLDVQARGEAALALAAIAPEDVRVMTLLRESLKLREPSYAPPENQMRGYAVLGLERVAKANGQTVSLLISVLSESGVEFRPALTNRFAEAGLSNEAASQAYAKAVQDWNASVDFSAHVINALGRIGPATPEVIPTLIAALRSHEDTIRLSAVRALGVIGPDAAAAVPPLLELLRASQQLQASLTTPASDPPRWTLAPVVPEESGAMPVRGIMLPDGASLPPTAPAQPSSASLPPSVLLRYGLISSGRLPEAGRMSSRLDLRRDVIETIGKIGPRAKSAITGLTAVCEDKANPYRLDAAMARWRINAQDQEAKAVLVDGLTAGKGIRRRAIELLSQLGVRALPELIVALANSDYGVRVTAIESLAAMGADAEPALSDLLKALGDEKYMVRRAATNALSKIQRKLLDTAKAKWTRK